MKPNDIDIREYLIIMRYLSGDEQAFQELYDMHSEGTQRYLRSMVDPDIADDLQQQVWIMVYTRLKDLLNPGSFRAWLYRIARYEALDHIRWRKTNARKQAAFEHELHTEDGDELLGPDDIEMVLKRLNELPEDRRELIILNYLEGLTYNEIALITGSPIGTVRSRIHHAKQNLKELIESKR